MVSSVNLPTPDVGEIDFGAEELTMARYRDCLLYTSDAADER